MNTVILGSGKGSNAEAVLRAQAGQLLGNARVKAILADVPDAGILRIAQENGVESHSLEGGSFKTKLDERTEEIWIEKIRSLDPELIVLAGFMRVLKSPFLDAFGGRVINLHPSLLPSFKGLDAINQAFDYGVGITGCTVHWVNEEIDGGRIIAQSPVRIMTGDTLEMVEQKVHAVEHMLLPAVIRDLSTGAIPFPES